MSALERDYDIYALGRCISKTYETGTEVPGASCAHDQVVSLIASSSVLMVGVDMAVMFVVRDHGHAILAMGSWSWSSSLVNMALVIIVVSCNVRSVGFGLYYLYLMFHPTDCLQHFRKDFQYTLRTTVSLQFESF